MEKNRIFETVVGAVVLMSAVLFFVYSYNKSSLSDLDSGYPLSAQFDCADGISSGSDVKISGVSVGKVSKVQIDPKTFLADVKFSVRNDIKLPVDTEAYIATEGILGGKYIAISVGYEDKFLKKNACIDKTRGAQNLESLINQFLMSSGNK